MGKQTFRPPLPEKMKPITIQKPRSSRQDWEKYINTHLRRLTKIEHKQKSTGFLDAFDLTGQMLERRKRVLLDTLPQIYSRYSERASAGHPNMLGEAWVKLNTSFFSYAFVEAHYHILYAASIWILDHIDVDRIFPYLPKDEKLLDDYFDVDIWHPQYSEELIVSVFYVLSRRNGEPEITENGLKKVISDRVTATGTQHTETPERAAFDGVLSLIPSDAIEHATKAFEELLWKWTSRYFEGVLPLHERLCKALEDYETVRCEYNSICDQIETYVKELDRHKASQKAKLKKGPVKGPMMLPNTVPDLISPMQLPTRLPGMLDSRDMELEKITGKLFSFFEDLDRLNKQSDAAWDEIDQAQEDESDFTISIMRGETWNNELSDLPVGDPFELCFALLYLLDSGSDIPWIYGAGVGLMQIAVESLPWGICRYEEDRDAFWNEFKYKGKKIRIPDWNERKYCRKDDYFARSLNQLLYEETGCVMPRNLHIYDRRAKALSKYGVNDNESIYLLSIMTALAHARRQRAALNLEGEFDDDTTPTQESKASEDNTAAYREEIKRLRSALHEAEKTARDANKALEESKKQALLEHRELADLRELVFTSENESTEQPDETPSTEVDYPYTVKRNTLVFGGHDSWTKAIRQLLKGNIRFVDKDYLFDTSIIRHAECIWIQPNAMSHKQYYRIVDTARIYKTPVRYFTNASAQKCADQLVREETAQR